MSSEIKKMNKLVAYLRVSTKTQAGNYSFEIQKERINAFAKEFNYEIIEYVSETINGDALDRKGFNKVLKMLKNDKNLKVIVLKPDRLSRDARGIISLMNKELKGRVRFCNLGNENPNGLMLSLMFLWSDYEKSLINERTRAGIKKARENGVYAKNGRSKRCMNEMTKIIKEKQGERDALRFEILNKKIKILKFRKGSEAINFLNGNGIKTRNNKKWRLNEFYIEMRWFKKQLIKRNELRK